MRDGWLPLPTEHGTGGPHDVGDRPFGTVKARQCDGLADRHISAQSRRQAISWERVLLVCCAVLAELEEQSIRLIVPSVSLLPYVHSRMTCLSLIAALALFLTCGWLLVLEPLVPHGFGSRGCGSGWWRRAKKTIQV